MSETVVFSSLLSFLGPIKDWVQFLKSEKKEKLLANAEAIDALHEAICETTIYISNSRSNGRVRETEENLARLWHTASRKLDRVNSELAQRCLLKGQYWADPEVWTNEAVQKARIELDRVQDDICSLKEKIGANS